MAEIAQGSESPRKLWRFTRFLDYVIVESEQGEYVRMNPAGQAFTVIGRNKVGEVYVLVGEFVGGPVCGLRFCLAPSDEDYWDQLAVKA